MDYVALTSKETTRLYGKNFEAWQSRG